MSPVKDRSLTPGAMAGVDEALLSLDESRRLARPLRGRSEAERDCIHGIFYTLYAEWLADWGCSLRGKLPPAVRILDAAPLSVLTDVRARQLLAPLLFGEGSTAAELQVRAPDLGMAESLAEQAWVAWQDRLAQTIARPDHAAGNSEPDAQREASAPWSGALYVAFAWAPQGDWVLHMDATSADQLLLRHGRVPAAPIPLQPGAVLTPLAQVLGSRALALRVELDPVSLSLGQLQSLTLGDVVTLTHRLESPAQIFVNAPTESHGLSRPVPRTPFSAAWLGQREGHMAVELVPTP